MIPAAEAYNNLVPELSARRAHRLDGPWPSMGATPQAIPNRLQRGEPADVVIMVGEALTS
jgi:molybdate transport system substrate-binding protein